MKIIVSIAVLALLGHTNAVTIRRQEDDFFYKAQSSSEHEDSQREVEAAQQNIDAEKLRGVAQTIHAQMSQDEKVKQKEMTKSLGFEPKDFTIVNDVQIGDEVQDSYSEVQKAKEETELKEYTRNTYKKLELLKVKEEDPVLTEKKLIKSQGFEPSRFTVMSSQFDVPESAQVQLRQVWAELDQKKEDNLIQVADDEDDLRNAEVLNAISQVKEKKEKKEKQNEVQKQEQYDRKFIMADGLIHRPDGVILDSASHQVVSGVNSDSSSYGPSPSQIDKKQASLTQANAGTIMDSSNQFDVRTVFEKEDFKRQIELSKLLNFGSK